MHYLSLMILLLFGSTQIMAATVAAGYYSTTQKQLPLLITQDNKDPSSWHYVIDSTAENLPTNFSNYGVFSDVTCENDTCIAVGKYYDRKHDVYLPMIAQSYDGNTHWEYAIDAKPETLPNPDVTLGSFNSVSCNERMCVAVGNYVHKSKPHTYPLLAQSKDKGKTWEYKITSEVETLPHNYEAFGILNSVSCAETVCMASGSYWDTSFETYPMVVVSDDSGKTWVYAIDAKTNLHPQYKTGGSFQTVSCDNFQCIAGGRYYDKRYIYSGYLPLLAVTQDAGETWDYVIDSEPDHLPANFSKSGHIESVHCDAGQCLAGGQYHYCEGLDCITVPFLARNQAENKIWHYAIELNKNLPQDFLRAGLFRSVACSNELCIAAGHYHGGIAAPTIYPMIAISNDSGKNWRYTIDSTQNLPFDYEKWGFFNSVSCKANQCVAGGQYYNLNQQDSGYYPMLAVSNNRGNSWIYKVSADPNTLPSNAVQQPIGAEFFSTSN